MGLSQLVGNHGVYLIHEGTNIGKRGSRVDIDLDVVARDDNLDVLTGRHIVGKREVDARVARVADVGCRHGELVAADLFGDRRLLRVEGGQLDLDAAGARLLPDDTDRRVLGLCAEDKITVSVHEIAGGRVDVEHTRAGVEDIPVIVHDLKEPLTGDRHVEGVAGRGHGRNLHQQVDARERRAVTDRGRVDTAAAGGTLRRVAHVLVEHVAEGCAAGFETVGVGVRNVVADDVQPLLMRAQAGNAGIH